MSRALNHNVIAYIPRKVEAAATAIGTETLTCPLPTKPSFAHSPRHIRHRRDRTRVTLNAPLQSLEENVRVIHTPAAPSIASPLKCHDAKLHNRRRQRRGKQPHFDCLNTSQETGRTKQPLCGSSRTLAERSSLTDRRQEESRERKQLSDLLRLKKGARELGCHRSPYLPKTVEEYMWHKEQKRRERGMKRSKTKKIRMAEVGCPQVEDHGRNCMGGKRFDTNHSAVLSIKTMWCPSSWPDEQKKAKWPLTMEFDIEGSDRHKNGYGRFFPVPRSEEFEWRLATPEWLANPKGTKHPVWDRRGEIPVQEKRFATIRGELDCIIGSGRWVDEEYLFDRAEETAWEDGAETIGKALWEKIEEDGREYIEEAVKKERGVSEEEGENNEMEEAKVEDVYGEMEEAVDEGVEEEGRRLFENLAL